MPAELRQIAVTPRTQTTKGGRKRLRASGRVPAVIYGRGLEPTLVSVEESVFTRLLPEAVWHTSPLKLTVQDAGGFSPTVMIAEVQRNLITERIISADFHAVSMEETVRAQVPIHLVGHSLAAAKGGIIERPAHELTVEARPADLPEQIEVDISGLTIGDRVRVRDLALPPDVKVLESPEEVILVISAPAKPAEAEVEEGAAAVVETTQPEVVRPQEK